MFYTYLGKVRFTNCSCGMAQMLTMYWVDMRVGKVLFTKCFCGIAQLRALYCALHALKQCQANELLLLFHSSCMFCIVLCTCWGNLRLSNCFCGLAQLYVCYVVSHKLKQYLALWDWPDACFVLCFSCIEPSISLTNCYCGTAQNPPDVSVVWCFTQTEAMSAWRFAFVGSLRCMFRIEFYTQWGNVRPTNCYCVIAQMNVCYCVLHALKQS